MKKIFSVLLVLSMLLIASVALAEDTGIQIIGGPEAEAEVVSLDDFKVGDIAEIAGYGEVTLNSAYWVSSLPKYDSVTYYSDWDGKWWESAFYESGDEAIYLRLVFDILNTQKESYNFYDDFSEIICTYDDEYQFGGWVRQHIIIEDSGKQLHTLSASDVGWPIGMMYRGQYSVVVTLPLDVYTRVMEQDKPLTVSFKLGENEFTYIWREK